MAIKRMPVDRLSVGKPPMPCVCVRVSIIAGVGDAGLGWNTPPIAFTSVQAFVLCGITPIAPSSITVTMCQTSRSLGVMMGVCVYVIARVILCVGWGIAFECTS